MVTFNPPVAVQVYTQPEQILGNNSEAPSSTVSASSQVPGAANNTVPPA